MVLYISFKCLTAFRWGVFDSDFLNIQYIRNSSFSSVMLLCSCLQACTNPTISTVHMALKIGSQTHLNPALFWVSLRVTRSNLSWSRRGVLTEKLTVNLRNKRILEYLLLSASPRKEMNWYEKREKQRKQWNIQKKNNKGAHARRKRYERKTEMRRQANNGSKLRILREKKNPAERQRHTHRVSGTKFKKKKEFSVLLLMARDTKVIKNRGSTSFIIKFKIF